MKRLLCLDGLWLSVLIGLWLGVVAEVPANPDFTASEISAANDTVLEGAVAHFKLMLRNRGDAPADPVQLRIQWPIMGHLIEVTGADNVHFDQDDRVVTASISLPVGSEREVDAAVLAPRDSAGRSLTLSAQAIHYHTMAETWMHQSVTIDTRPKTDGILLGRLRIAPAGVATLIWLAVTLAALLAVSLIRGSRKQGFFGARAGVLAIMIALGFWLIFAAMAWRDYCVLYAWPETTGTIVSRRVQIETVNASQPRQSGSNSQPSAIAKPEFALRYVVNDQAMLSTGYDTGSSLRVGGGKAQLAKEFKEWAIGAQVPCWYDPLDPADVVIKRGFGGAYFFAVLPLFPFWLGWSILHRRFSSERCPPGV